MIRQRSFRSFGRWAWVNVNDPTTKLYAHEALLLASTLLAKRTLGVELPDSVVKSVFEGQPSMRKIGNNQIEVVREDWPTNRGYEVKFFIR